MREQGMAIVGDAALVERVAHRAIETHRNAPSWNPPNPHLFEAL